MKALKLIITLFLIINVTDMCGQFYEKLKNNNNEVVDSFLVAKFPNNIPYEFTQMYYQFVNRSRLHNGRLDLIINTDLHDRRTNLTADDIRYNRRNLGVYYYNTNVTEAKLYKYGVVTHSLSLPIEHEGTYIIIIMKSGEAEFSDNLFLGKVLEVVIDDGLVKVSSAMQPD